MRVARCPSVVVVVLCDESIVYPYLLFAFCGFGDHATG
jgi:hypothetical protein